MLLPSKRLLCSSIALCATLVSSVLSIQVAQAGSMYIYRDTDGQILLTNVTPQGTFDKFTQQVRVTDYPDAPGTAARITAPASATNNQYPTSYQGFSTPSNSRNRNAYDAYIRASATRHGIDPGLMKAMMHTESAFNPNARSPAGAQGLMQLMPATARRFSVRNAYNPAENIEGAAKYIAWLTNRFDGNMEHVVAGYNAGEGNVDRYGGIPPFRETQNYVRRVLGRYNTLYARDTGLIVASANSASSLNTPIVRSSTSGGRASISQGGVQRASFGTSRNYAQSAYDALR